MREKLNLDINVPVEIRLKFPNGKMMEDRGYGPSVLYTTSDDFAWFVDLELSTRITNLGLAPNESFWVCKQQKAGEKRARINVWLTPAGEKRRAAEEMEREAQHAPDELRQQLAGTIANLSEGKPAAAPRPTPMPPAVERRLNTLPPAPQLGTGTTGPAPAPRMAASAIPLKATYTAAWEEFLLIAARATSGVEKRLGAEGITLRVDSRDVVAVATTCFIAADKAGFLTWRPGECV